MSKFPVKLVFLLLSILLLSSCGKNTLSSTQQDSDNTQSIIDNTAFERPSSVDWATHTIAQFAKQEDEELLYLTTFYDNWLKNPNVQYDRCYRDFSALNGDFCVKSQYICPLADNKVDLYYTISYFDHLTANATTATISPDMWGYTNNNVTFSSFDIASKGEVGILSYMADDNGKGGYLINQLDLLFYSMQNGTAEKMDLLPALTESGLLTDDFKVYLLTLKIDSTGNSYLIYMNQILVIDSTGKLLTVMKPSGDTDITCIGKATNQLPVFDIISKSDNKHLIFCYNENNQDMHVLGKIVDFNNANCGFDYDGNIIFSNSMDMLSWNTKSGKLTRIFSNKQNVVCSNPMTSYYGFSSDDKLWILDAATDDLSIYVMSSEKPDSETIIEIDIAAYGWDDVVSAAAVYSRKHPGISIICNSTPQEPVDSMKLMSEITAGNASDLLVIDYEDFVTLSQKDALLDLSDVFDKEMKEQVFDYVWEAGTDVQKLYGLCDKQFIVSMIASNAKYPGSDITLDELLSLIKKENPDTFQGIAPMSDSNAALLYYLLIQSLPEFVDFAEGTCDFSDNRFKELLTYCHDTVMFPDTMLGGTPQKAKAVIDGNYLGTLEYIFDLSSFSESLHNYQDGYHFIGLPSTNKSGNSYSPGAMLVVNKDTKYSEIVKDFLKFLFSAPYQQKAVNCIRKDVLRECVIKASWDDKYYFDYGDGNMLLLLTKPDGSSYVEDFIAFRDKAKVIPAENHKICTIILEETEGYMNDEKDIDSTIEIIQNRVKLLLNEQYN